jgi:hypothetical protein
MPMTPDQVRTILDKFDKHRWRDGEREERQAEIAARQAELHAESRLRGSLDDVAERLDRVEQALQPLRRSARRR